jgi:Tol biopolymer transport system component
MNRARIFITLFLVIFIMFFIAPSQEALPQESAEQLYEAALFKKEAEGDLEGAIKIFQKIIAEYAENRKISARAQLQIGKCLEKLGLEDASRAYQRVIDNYPEQEEEVREARENLSLLIRAETVLEKRDREFKIRKFSTPDVDIYGSPSLDGRYLSYVDWTTGNLAVLEIATGKTRHLTDDATWEDPSEFALSSITSPNSKLVAYSWWNLQSTYDLRLVGIDGSGRRILYGDEDYVVYPAQWSSDGKKIAIIRYSRKNKNYQIVWISVDDGSVHVLKTMENGKIARRVCHSPDDRFIAYDSPVEEDSGNYDIYLLSGDGNSETPLVKHPANDKLLGWAPGRKEILFLSDRSGTWDAFLIQVKDGKALGSPRRIKGEIGQAEPLGFTQDGSYYFGLSTRWFNTHIAALDLQAGKQSEPLKQPIVGSSFNPVWSPDGEYLAYVTEKTKPGGPGFFDHVLHIHSFQTGKSREVPCGLRRIRNPCWSPDGSSIVVTGTIKGTRPENYQGGLYQIDIQTGETKALVKYAFGPPLRVGMWGTINCEWSPDGEAVFYITRESILKHEMDSGKEKEIYRNKNILMTRRFYRPLALSPDGKRLVFGIKHPEKFTQSLMIMSSSGGDTLELLKLPKSERIRAIAWTPDGEYVLFMKGEKKGTSLWRISPQGGDTQKLWQSEKQLTGLSVHPDGRQIAFYTTRVDKEIWVMENFLPVEITKKK